MTAPARAHDETHREALARKHQRADGPKAGSAAYLDKEMNKLRDKQLLTIRCALCDWSQDGTAGFVLEAARAHRQAEHPGRGRRRKRRAA